MLLRESSMSKSDYMKKRFLKLLDVFSIFILTIGPCVISGQGAPDKFQVTHGPYLQRMTDNSVSLVWTTNQESIGWVEVAPDDKTNFYHKERPKYFDTRNGLKNVSTLHIVDLTGLSPHTRYRYRIFSQEVLSHKWIELDYGRTVGTRVFGATPPSFFTNDYNKKEVSFLMVNDIHERNEMLKNLLKGTDWKNTDFVLFNGDMVSSSRSEEQVFAGFMDTAVKLFAGQIPMYYARGNHETRGEFASRFADYFPGAANKLYYVFRQGPVAFIVLDSGEDKPDDDIEYGGITDFDEYRTAQEKWLLDAVKDPLFANASFKLAVMHIPPLNGWHGEVEVANKFAKVLNDAGIDLMLCAHYHRFVRKNPGESGFNFPIIVNSNHAVIKATVNDRKFNMKIVDANGSIVDNLVIEK